MTAPREARKQRGGGNTARLMREFVNLRRETNASAVNTGRLDVFRMSRCPSPNSSPMGF